MLNDGGFDGDVCHNRTYADAFLTTLRTSASSIARVALPLINMRSSGFNYAQRKQALTTIDMTSGATEPSVSGGDASPRFSDRTMSSRSHLPSAKPLAAIVFVIAEALGVCILSGLGSLFRVSSSWANFGLMLAQQLATALRDREVPRDDTIRMLLDESLTQLRELGDLSLQEARLLQQNLLTLSQHLRELDNSTSATARRYARTKP